MATPFMNEWQDPHRALANVIHLLVNEAVAELLDIWSTADRGWIEESQQSYRVWRNKHSSWVVEAAKREALDHKRSSKLSLSIGSS